MQQQADTHEMEQGAAADAPAEPVPPAAAGCAATATIHDLPDSLLGAVFARLGRGRAAAALLVSKRWHRAFLSEPALWRELSIKGLAPPVSLQSDLALLRRVGGLVASLTLSNPGDEMLAAALSYLQPNRLQQLAVVDTSSIQLLSGLQRFSCLTRLQLQSSFISGGGLATALPQLAQLCSLSLAVGIGGMSPQLVAAVISMAQLRELSLGTNWFDQPEALRHLTLLRQLTSLRLEALSEGAQIYVPEPMLFPSLTSLSLHGYDLPDGAGVQVAGWAISACSYEESNADFVRLHGSSGMTLTVREEREEGSLPQLLSALRPGGVPAIRRLHLQSCLISPAVLGQCAELSSVVQLTLEECDAGGSWEATMAALLRQAPLLASLSLEYCSIGALPQCLVEHTRLRRLSLWYNSLEALPAGPYLAGLQWLTLSDSSLQQLPPALAAATALTSLELRSLELHAAPPSTDGLAALLSHMPGLRHFELSCCGRSLEQLPLKGWAGLAALHSLNLYSNSLTSLPAALSQATSLRQLYLHSNEQLAPTAQQLGALLARLPLLEELELSGCRLMELPAQLPSGLLSLDVSCNSLRSLPTELASQSLTRLNLEHNSTLSLTRADADSLLARLPRLRSFEIWGTNTLGDVQAYARNCLSFLSH